MTDGKMTVVDLETGFVDASGTAHKRAVFRQRTMRDEVEMKSDATVLELQTSSATTKSANFAVNNIGHVEFREFMVVVLKKLLVKLGTLERQDALNSDCFMCMTTSDIERMIDAVTNQGVALVPYEKVLDIARLLLTQEKRQAFQTALDDYLGNLQPTGGASGN